MFGKNFNLGRLLERAKNNFFWRVCFLCSIILATNQIVHSEIDSSLQAYLNSNPSVLKIIINVPSRTLKLVADDQLIKTYPVGVGLSAKFKTPPGVYSIDQKVINPIWEHPYKKPGEVRIGAETAHNPLGKYWIGFHSDQGGSYGVHGTNKEETVGKFVSHGCVRMKNKDIEELFHLLKYQSFVFITYERYELSFKQDSVFLEVFPDPYKQRGLSADEIIRKIKNDYPEASIDREILTKALQEQDQKKVYEVALIKTSLPQASIEPRYSLYTQSQAQERTYQYQQAPQAQQQQQQIYYNPYSYQQDPALIQRQIQQQNNIYFQRNLDRLYY